TVDNFVSSLKKKLGWKPGAGYRIQTVRSVGYRMEVEPPNG
ncbi:MAG: winged helix-turn-helix domain-containing protein, partial [Myxococcota bacterium]